MRATEHLSGAIRRKARGGLLFGWLLIALFIEYSRPTNQFLWLDFPFFYSIVPISLLLFSMFASGLRPLEYVMADRIAKWILILIGLVFISMVVSGFEQRAVTSLTSMLGYLFLFILITRLVTSEARIRGVITTLVAAHIYLLWVNPEVLSNPETRNYIVGGTFLGDGNDYSLSLCILFPCVVEIALSRRSFISRLISWGAVIVIVLAITATQSRGGSLGLGAVLIYLWFRSSHKFTSSIGIAIVVGAVLAYAPPAYFQRMSTVSNMQIDGSAQGRIDAWKGAIGMGLKSPVLGIGTGQFGARWGKNAHSNYMLALAELGIPGFICVLMLVFGNMKANAQLMKRIKAKGDPPSTEVAHAMRLLDFLNAGVLGFAVAGAFLSATYYPHMFVITGLCVSARAIAWEKAQRREVIANTPRVSTRQQKPTKGKHGARAST